jgi:ATP-dependent protease ClpP protease subunit
MAAYNEDNVFFIGDFDDQLEQIFVPLAKEIKKQRNFKHGLIDLHVNSFGGYLHLVRGIVDLVELAKSKDITVRTIVSGVAYSAGSMLAITGTPGERYISREGEHLIHYGRSGSLDETPEQNERSYQAKRRSFKQILDHYNKYTNVPDLELEMLDDGFTVMARNAIKWGLADKYTDKLIL